MSDTPATPPPPPPPPAGDARTPAWKSRRAWIVLLVVTVFGVASDLATKTIAFRTVGPQPALSDAVDRALLSGRFGDAARAAKDFRERVGGSGFLSSLVAPGSTVRVIPNVLELSLVYNHGAVFGIGAGKRWAFILFTFGALAFALWMFGWWTGPRDRWAHAAIGLLIAGGLGNLYDRLVYACVRDFIHPLPGVKLPFGWTLPSGERDLWPYVSNLADLWLIVGIGVLMVSLFRHPHPRRAAQPTA